MPLSANAPLFHAFICYRIVFSAIPHQSETKDPDPHPHQGNADLQHCTKQSRGRSQWRPGGSQIPIILMMSRIWIRNRNKIKSWIHILITVNSWVWSRISIKAMRIRSLDFKIFRKKKLYYF
jgi:hypothetical protein